MAEKKIRVFISSSQKELEPERLALFALITTDPFLKEHFEPVLFEKLPPPSRPTEKPYLKELEKCQIYVLMLDREYGPLEENYSATHHEYNLARKKDMPSLAMIKGRHDAGREPRTQTFIDAMADHPYMLHFFEMTIRGMNSKGKPQPLYGEVVAIREELTESTDAEYKFSVIPADCLLDLPSHQNSPSGIQTIDPKPAADFLKTSYQMDRRKQCQQEREHFAAVCREYLEKSFTVRIHTAQDRVMHLRAREKDSPEVALARQRAENDLTDLERMKNERLAGLERLSIARHGPIKHIASALVFTSAEAIEPQLEEITKEIDPELRRKIELAAEDIVIKYETTQGRECERVGHLKIGFDIRSLAQADPHTGYRDPVTGVRRIEVKGRKRGQPIRLTINEWYKATQLGDSYWLYVAWDPLENPDAEPIRIKNPAKKLDHAKREIIAARFFEIPAEAVMQTARVHGGSS